MPLVETESLVIKTYNLAEADRIVVLFTRDHGVVRGVAKGAKRLKSKFGSSIEPFSVVRASYFEKDSVELVSIQRIDLIKSYFEAASNPDFLQKFSYLGDLLITVSPPHDPNETLYRMVKACIETAASDPSTIASTGVYFELWMLQLGGYMPDWSKCEMCSRPLDETEDTSINSAFHLICTQCRPVSAGRLMDGETRAIASGARRDSPKDFAEKYFGKDEKLKNLSNLFRQMISRSIGREVGRETSLAVNP